MKTRTFIEKIIRNPVVQTLVLYISGGWIILEITQYLVDFYELREGIINVLLIVLVTGLVVAIFLAIFLHSKKSDVLPEEISRTQGISTKEKIIFNHNLPIQLTSFIGRQKEMPLVRKMIGEHRLVTVTGAGGCGKTRLAIETATRMVQDFQDGVWFIDLAPIASGELVAKEITEVLKIKERTTQIILETLVDSIRDKNLMIILDNCEHLVKACA